MRVGVVKRGKYGERLIETIRQQNDFEVVTAEIPELLPGFIEDPEEFLKGLNLDLRVFQSDILILYTFHPDLTPVSGFPAGASASCTLRAGGDNVENSATTVRPASV